MLNIPPNLPEITPSMPQSGFKLSVQAGFGTQKYQPTLKLNGNIKHYDRTSPHQTQNPH
jgi:hypothetical protein